ncbi:hypothetical protein [Defluviicoccus vanus]|uniref:Uncharacterized protein n=1 Tax=Defluviicoccus vanus TaxID=111831 RepID=A0A7H1MZQ4_9PROT|nr:hypothetical protein [Defluviicoccus vanus]QNT68940.1 hypothetical protein HQ394_05685 [Defluviicoccus vanus]
MQTALVHTGEPEQRVDDDTDRNSLRSAIGRAEIQERAEVVEQSVTRTLDHGGILQSWLEDVYNPYLMHLASHNVGILVVTIIPQPR